MLYEIASCKKPFQRGSAVQTMTAIIEAEPEPLDRALPAPPRCVIERCLAKDPRERYTASEDLYRDLRRLRDNS